MKKNKNIIVIFLILFISIGFAYLSTTLNIGGSVTFKENNFDIHFENIQVISEDVSYETLEISNTTPTTINASINFKEPSEIFEYIVDVVNGGGIDALFQSIDNNLNASNQDYITIEIKYFDGTEINENDVLRMGQSKRIRVKVIYNYDIENLPTIKTTSITTTINYINANVRDITYDRKVWNFDYTGYEQIFIAPKTGTYKLEVWGAQGGAGYSQLSKVEKGVGGYGGYSTGTYTINADSRIYVIVGGKGTDAVDGPNNDFAGGYNGGGQGGKESTTGWGAGGGATHIALDSGLLKTLSSHKDDNRIIIVAGGGGGAGDWDTWINSTLKHYANDGGSAGGYIGNSGIDNYHADNGGGTNAGSGGTQTTAGSNSSGVTFPGGFGYGGASDYFNGVGNRYSAGGGGGYYGGGSGAGYGSAAGGGSGYIGNTNLSDKIMYCYNCQESTEEDDETDIKTRTTDQVLETPTSQYAKIGNGYARITYIGN